VLPAQIFFVTGGVVRAVLMAHGRFRTQAAAPLLYNGGIIVGGLVTGDIEGFAWGALGGAILGQWAYPLWDMRQVGGVSLRVAPWDPRFHAYLWRALPLMIGVSLTTVDEWYEKYFGGQVGVGVIASLAYARRLMMAPVAIIGQAVAAAALPALAAMHAEGRGRDLDAALLGTLRATVALAIAAAGAVFVLATPIVTLVYQRGAFGADDVARVAPLLALLALAVPGWVAQQVAIRAFFAREETWRPMLLGSALAVAVIPLYRMLGDRLGGEGLAIAGVIAISLNAAVTLVWAQLRFGGPSLSALAGTAVRAVSIAVVSSLATAWATRWAVRELVAIPVVGDSPWLALGVGALVYGALLLIGTRLAGDAAMREALAGILTRLGGLVRRLGGAR
jgi:putative peptidoglycan lipid II flippase